MESAPVTPIAPALAAEQRWYLRPREAVELTGIAKSVVYEALASGALPGYRMGRSWLITPDALRTWIESRSREAA